MLKRTEFFRLTVSYWPRAVEAGLRPVKSRGFEEGEQFYAPHSFDFDQVPSRADFLDVQRQLPWASVWNDTLMPLIAKHPWPLIDYAHKVATVDLLDEQGREVGRLEVCKMDLWMNEPKAAPFIHCEHEQHFLRRIRGAERKEAARKAIDKATHTIQERVMEHRHWDEDTILFEVERFLHEQGFLSRRILKLREEAA